MWDLWCIPVFEYVAQCFYVYILSSIKVHHRICINGLFGVACTSRTVTTHYCLSCHNISKQNILLHKFCRELHLNGIQYANCVIINSRLIHPVTINAEICQMKCALTITSFAKLNGEIFYLVSSTTFIQWL